MYFHWFSLCKCYNTGNTEREREGGQGEIKRERGNHKKDKIAQEPEAVAGQSSSVSSWGENICHMTPENRDQSCRLSPAATVNCELLKHSRKYFFT